MLGKFSSIEVLVKKLRENEVDNYAVMEFVQGSKTRRWGVAWSFADLRPIMGAARGVDSLQKSLLPFPAEYLIAVSPCSPFDIRLRLLEPSQVRIKWKLERM